MTLDCFVMFSSVSSIFGNPAQGNYARPMPFSMPRPSSARARPAGAYHELGRSRRRRLRGAQRTRRRIPRTARNHGNLAGRSDVAARIISSRGNCPGNGDSRGLGKWRQFFRSMQENPLLERIFASVEDQEASGATSDWRVKSNRPRRQKSKPSFARPCAMSSAPSCASSRTVCAMTNR